MCGMCIPIYDIEAMQVLQGHQELRSVESAPVLVKLALALQMVEQFAAVYCKSLA